MYVCSKYLGYVNSRLFRRLLKNHGVSCKKVDLTPYRTELYVGRCILDGAADVKRGRFYLKPKFKEEVLLALEAERKLRRLRDKFDVKEFLEHLPYIPYGYGTYSRRYYKSGKLKLEAALEISENGFMHDYFIVEFAAYVGSRKICDDYHCLKFTLSEYFNVDKLKALIQVLGENNVRLIPNRGLLKWKEC